MLLLAAAACVWRRRVVAARPEHLYGGDDFRSEATSSHISAAGGAPSPLDPDTLRSLCPLVVLPASPKAAPLRSVGGAPPTAPAEAELDLLVETAADALTSASSISGASASGRCAGDLSHAHSATATLELPAFPALPPARGAAAAPPPPEGAWELPAPPRGNPPQRAELLRRAHLAAAAQAARRDTPRPAALRVASARRSPRYAEEGMSEGSSLSPATRPSLGAPPLDGGAACRSRQLRSSSLGGATSTGTLTDATSTVLRWEPLRSHLCGGTGSHGAATPPSPASLAPRRHEHWAAAHVPEAWEWSNGAVTAGAAPRHASPGGHVRHAGEGAAARRRAPLPRGRPRGRASVLDRVAAAAALRPRAAPHGARERRAHYLNQAFEITARPPPAQRLPPPPESRSPARQRSPPVILGPAPCVAAPGGSESAPFSVTSAALGPGGHHSSVALGHYRSDAEASESLRLLPGVCHPFGCRVATSALRHARARAHRLCHWSQGRACVGMAAVRATPPR